MMTLGEGEQLTKMLNMARGSLKKSTSLLNKMQTDIGLFGSFKFKDISKYFY